MIDNMTATSFLLFLVPLCLASLTSSLGRYLFKCRIDNAPLQTLCSCFLPVSKRHLLPVMLTPHFGLPAVAASIPNMMHMFTINSKKECSRIVQGPFKAFSG
uniref:Secreted protein n=1 Tax=Rhipicephalus appendiculatus TaxID=34631 RepID=A0A131Y9F0_RHIAP